MDNSSDGQSDSSSDSQCVCIFCVADNISDTKGLKLNDFRKIKLVAWCKTILRLHKKK